MSIRNMLVVASLAAGTAAGDINFGPYTFDDLAFGDRIVDNDGGTYFFNSATTLDDALLGFSPTTGLYNIGFDTASNDFTMYFDDLQASDIAGTDIVLFDIRFSADPYEVAVISGGVESVFLTYDASSQVNTGETKGAQEIWAVEIDLADYGVSTAEAIRFRALENVGGNVEGDPIMAGVLVPVPAGSALLGLGLVASRRRR